MNWKVYIAHIETRENKYSHRDTDKSSTSSIGIFSIDVLLEERSSGCACRNNSKSCSIFFLFIRVFGRCVDNARGERFFGGDDFRRWTKSFLIPRAAVWDRVVIIDLRFERAVKLLSHSSSSSTANFFCLSISVIEFDLEKKKPPRFYQLIVIIFFLTFYLVLMFSVQYLTANNFVYLIFLSMVTSAKDIFHRYLN